MFFMWIMFVTVTLTQLGPACRQKEYPTEDGQCCPMCHEGTVVGKDCTAQSGTRCVPCETGTYMNQLNGLFKCFTCSTCDPGVGLFAKQNCTSTSDTVCDVLSGYFCKSVTDTGCITAEKHSVCKPGQRIKQPGTSRNDMECEDCHQGSFSPDGVNCTIWTRCSENQTEVQEGSPTTNVVCRNSSLRKHHTHYTVLPAVLCLITVLLLNKGIKSCRKKKSAFP